jgi:hypothetical protein
MDFAITRIPREHNLEANDLANSVARQCQDVSQVVIDEQLLEI